MQIAEGTARRKGKSKNLKINEEDLGIFATDELAKHERGYSICMLCSEAF